MWKMICFFRTRTLEMSPTYDSFIFFGDSFGTNKQTRQVNPLMLGIWWLLIVGMSTFFFCCFRVAGSISWQTAGRRSPWASSALRSSPSTELCGCRGTSSMWWTHWSWRRWATGTSVWALDNQPWTSFSSSMWRQNSLYPNSLECPVKTLPLQRLSGCLLANELTVAIVD